MTENDKKRTVETILSLETGKQFEASQLLADAEERESEIFQLRQTIEFQIQTQTIDLVCLYCKQPVAIRGTSSRSGSSRHFYFTHPYKSKDCIIKTLHRLTEQEVRCIKYNGEKESKLHETLKLKIAQYLSASENISDVKVEKVFKDREVSKEWRKPDIMANFKRRRLAFELQLSTTFLSVIVGRTIFYKERNVFLVWIFPNFSFESDAQKFAQKDIFYNNNSNVYIFDEDAQKQSEQEEKLILKCCYQEFFIESEVLRSSWRTAFISLEDLSFQEDTISFFYSDSEGEKRKLLNIIEANKLERQKLANEIELKKRLDLEKLEAKRKKERIETALDFMREFYLTDRIPFYEDLSPIDFLKPDELNTFNEKLGFENKNQAIIANLFVDHTKPNFLQFTCEHESIYLNTNFQINNKSLLEAITELKDDLLFNKHIYLLFKSNHVLNERDRLFLEAYFDENKVNQTTAEREHIRRWALVSFYKKAAYPINLTENHQLIKLLYAIQSFKTGLVIGAGFDNLKQVANNILHSYPDFYQIFIDCLKGIGKFEQLFSEDSKGTIKAKLEKLEFDQPLQNRKFNGIIYEIFLRAS